MHPAITIEANTRPRAGCSIVFFYAPLPAFKVIVLHKDALPQLPLSNAGLREIKPLFAREHPVKLIFLLNLI